MDDTRDNDELGSTLDDDDIETEETSGGLLGGMGDSDSDADDSDSDADDADQDADADDL